MLDQKGAAPILREFANRSIAKIEFLFFLNGNFDFNLRAVFFI